MKKKFWSDLFFSPHRWQIQVDCQVSQQLLRFSVPIYRAEEISESVKSYVLSRENQKFKPHSTYYVLQRDQVVLIQEIPLVLKKLHSSKQDLKAFLLLAKSCYQMFLEIDQEDHLQHAYQLSNRHP